MIKRASQNLVEIYQDDVGRFFNNELFHEGFFKYPERLFPKAGVRIEFRSSMNAWRQPYGTKEEVICIFSRESMAAMGLWLVDAVYARASIGLIVSTEQALLVDRLVFQIEPDYEESDSNDTEPEEPYSHNDGPAMDLPPFRWALLDALADYHKPGLKVFIHVLYDELRTRRNVMSISGRASSMLYLASCFLWASHQPCGAALVSGSAAHQFITQDDSCWATFSCGQPEA